MPLPDRSLRSPLVRNPKGQAEVGLGCFSPLKRWCVGTLTYNKTGLIILFFWLLLGDFAWSMRNRSVGPAAQWYLTHLAVSNLIFGLLISSFPAMIGLVLSPIISVKSDLHRGKWGRRIPFLLLTTPLAVFGMLGLAVTPFLAEKMRGIFPEGNPMMISIVCFGVFWTAFEIASIGSESVFAGLINDVVPKELLGRFYGLFRAISLVDGMIFNYWIMGKVPEHFTLILVAIGLFYGLAFFGVCLKVKEGDYPPPTQGENTEENKKAFAGTSRYLKECFSSSYYWWIFILLTLASLTFSPVNIFSIPYAQNLGVNMDAFGKCLVLTFCISLGLSYFLGWLADIFHPLRMAVVTIAGYAFVAIYGWVFVNSASTFLTAFVLHGVLSGCYFTSAASLAQRLFPHEKFAQFASAATIISAPANMALAPLLGGAIDMSGNSYRYIFGLGFLLSLLSLGAAYQVYRQFIKLGGTENYEAPV